MHEVDRLSRGQCDEQDGESQSERERREGIDVDAVSLGEEAVRGRLDSIAPDVPFEPSTIKNARSSDQMMPNGLELSGPAKARSEYRAELAGSAPLACGLGRQRVVRHHLEFSSSAVARARRMRTHDHSLDVLAR